MSWSSIASNQTFDVGIDYESLKLSNGIAKFRIMTTDKADRSVMYEDPELDCQLKKMRSIWAKKYDSRNKVRGVNSTPSSWDSVQPNTIMSVIYTKTCV